MSSSNVTLASGRTRQWEMGRHKYRVDRGLSKQRDTPVKVTLSRRDKSRRFLHERRCDAFQPEEEEPVPGVTATRPQSASINHAHCKSVLQSSSRAFTENLRDEAFPSAHERSGSRASPAGRPAIQMRPQPEACRGGVMAATLKSIPSSGVESGTTSSSDDEDEDEDDEDGDKEDSSATSSSLPSPEIFRRESDVETLTLPFKKEPFGLHLKNSTLLDTSLAESIHMYHCPNLSDIIDASTILVKKSCEINKNKEAEAETKMHADSLNPGKVKWKTPQKLTHRRPILYKKKVWFKSPIVEARRTPAAKSAILSAGEPAHEPAHEPALEPAHEPALEPALEPAHEPALEPAHEPALRPALRPAHELSLSGQTQPLADPSRVSEIRLRPSVMLKRPVKRSPETAKFFDFVDANNREAFFKAMRERCDKLGSAPLFPLTAPAEHAEPPVL